MLKYLGLSRVLDLMRIIKLNGGFKNSVKKLIRFDALKEGKLVGVDKYGNRYYENPYYFYSSNRWVEYDNRVGLEYDASQIPAEWFGWMHYKTDLIPSCDPSRRTHRWMSNHSENYSGSIDQYYPYTTVRPKISAWNPNKK